MFKIKYLIIVIILISILYSCGYQNENNSKNETVTPSPTENTPSPTPTQSPVLAKFSTEIIDKDEERVSNIKLASDTLNGTVIKSGETFSFNKIVGKRSAEKGYKNATVMVGREKSKGLGGGVCQVSTTIYNAAAKCGLEISERHRHEITVSYAPDGNDASVNYGSLDLKFKNNLDCDIILFVHSDRDNVYAKIEKYN